MGRQVLFWNIAAVGQQFQLNLKIVFHLFVQDDILLIPDTLVLTLGTKLEHNSYTQFELQPNARLA
jgi:hypothetical protein